jgi:hypothetical protein
MDEIMEISTDGAFTLQPGLQYPGNPYYVKNGEALYNAKDPKKAAALLKEAGYKGEELVIITNSSYQSMYKAAQIVSEQLKAIGMKVRVDVFDWATAINHRRNKDAWNLWFTGQGSGPSVGPFSALKDVVSPAELPVEMNSFKSQQFRWAKGSIQVAKKLLPTIWRAKVPLGVKLEAFFHLTNNFAYPLLLMLSILLLPNLLVDIVGVPPATPSRTGSLALRVSPSPASGPLRGEFVGRPHAIGRIELFLADGRRVGEAHSARADLCRRLGRTEDATAAYERALGLTRQEPERRFLERRLAALMGR